MNRLIIPACLSLACAQAGEPLSYDNLPFGDTHKPLLLRTYLPDPGLEPGVLAHHDCGLPSPKYNPGQGRDVDGEYHPIEGIPAAIAVNHGPALSYAFDTTECRLLYAWQGGFLDMYPYWGSREGGRRRSFDYVPRLVGTLFMKASGAHPLRIDDTPLADLGAPRFLGYDLDDHDVPTFHFAVGDRRVSQRVEPLVGQPLACRLVFSVEGDHELGYRGGENTAVAKKDGALEVTLRGRAISTHEGFQRDMEIAQVSIAAGERVFTNYGCIACHSTDGSRGHGPTLQGLYGSLRPVEGSDELVRADADYLRESIAEPGEVIAEGFPPNYMPPYDLKPKELESIVLYLQSLAGE